jgi:hypothetical protein
VDAERLDDRLPAFHGPRIGEPSPCAWP